MTSRPYLFATLTLVLSSAFPSVGLAYCRTSSCKECPRDPETGCTIGGKPVAWPQACVSFSMHEEASEFVELDVATALMEQAFARWQAVRCPPHGDPPSIRVRRTEPVLCGETEYRPAQGNANIIAYRDDEWPYAGETNTLATTTVKFHEDTGEIYDVDMEVNATKPLLVSEQFTWSKAFVPGQNDLLSILTHEAGHFLGLDHSNDPDAVMKRSLDPGEINTELSPDDEAAICAAYPPEREAEPCGPTPGQEFSVQCSLDPTSGGACSIGIGTGPARGAGLAWFACLLTGLGYMSRRRIRM